MLANDLPAPQDIGFHRSMSRSFATEVDSASDQVLSLTNTLLDLVRQAQSEHLVAKGSRKKRTVTLQNVDDVTDDFVASVVDVVDHLFETADSCFDEAIGLKKKALGGQPLVASTSALPDSGSSSHPNANSKLLGTAVRTARFVGDPC